MESDDAKWDYKSEDGAELSDPDQPTSGQSVSWTASEYIDHQRGAQWYALLVILTAMTTVVVYFITKDYVATAVMVLAGLAVGIFSVRKPQQVTYELSSSGLKIGAKAYTYRQFRSYSIIQDGGLNSISFFPTKKFMTPLSAYFAPEDGDRILAAIGDHLPQEQKDLDAVEKISRRLRF